jgi:ribosome-binding factor A
MINMRENPRIIRINQEMKRELSVLIAQEIKDPRVNQGMVSVTNVETIPDLKYCKVYVSVLGDEKVKKDLLDGLRNAAGFIRKEIAARINLRITPEFSFKIDNSIEYSAHMEEMFKKIKE